MFFANLNVFIPLLAMLSFPLSMIFSFSFITSAVILGILWWQFGLSPKSIQQGRERRHRMGHRLVAGVNIIVVCSFVLPFLLAYMSGNNNLGMLAWFAIPVFVVGLVFWLIGLSMIWSARA